MKLLEPSPYAADEGNLIGRDPRTITASEWLEFGEVATGLKAIRAKCLDCAHTAAEVRKCTVTSCPLWPLRMGTKPKGLREARGESTEARKGNPDALRAYREANQ